jgi:membrane protein
MICKRQPRRRIRTLSDPHRISLRKLLRAVWYATDERNLGLIAAGVAFYGMFSIFPAMVATIAIWGSFADPAVISSGLSAAHDFIPEQAYIVLETQLRTLMQANAGTHGWATAFSLLIALYSVRSGVGALITGLNAVHSRSHAPILWRILGSLAMTLALIALVLAALGTVVVVTAVMAYVEFLGPWEGLILSVLPFVVMTVVGMVALGLFYRYGPNQPEARHAWIPHGALLAAILWTLASAAFSIYLANFSSYNRIYGSIGAVIALLMWFYISAYIVLLGGVVNAEIARMRWEIRARATHDRHH